MAEITAELVKQLRDKTSAGMMDCKKALAEAKGDMEAAQKWLREKGLASAAKRSGRATSQGAIESYIHMNGNIGVMVELNCETDFVAKTHEFRALARDIAMHIAALSPQYLKREDVPKEIIDKEVEIIKAQAKGEGKPEAVLQKIADGRISKFYSEICLEEQPFVRDTDKTVADFVKETASKFGENVQIRRFVRMQLGEE
jgi:elongation factor Ts